MEDKVNISVRYDTYCRVTTTDGRMCGLYSPHEGLHKDLRQGANEERWGDGDE